MNNDNTYGDIKKYWYDSNEYIVYDYENNYPIGKVETLIFNNNLIPNRYDINTYIIKNTLYIPDI